MLIFLELLSSVAGAALVTALTRGIAFIAESRVESDKREDAAETYIVKNHDGKTVKINLPNTVGKDDIQKATTNIATLTHS